MVKRAGDVVDLIDLVEAEPGWRVVETAEGWRIYPADKEHGVIHVRDFRELDVTRTQLRRAGFRPLLKLNEVKRLMPATAVKEPPAPPVALAPPPPPPPRDLIAEARGKINEAIEALSGLDTILGEIASEQESFAKVKQLLQSMLK
jgi:hypothetical protein